MVFDVVFGTSFVNFIPKYCMSHDVIVNDILNFHNPKFAYYICLLTLYSVTLLYSLLNSNSFFFCNLLEFST